MGSMKSPVAMEINEGQVAESAEEPEEGEIIDDFEVVSDDSITFSPQKQGKSMGGISPGLRALSLSSLTDLEVVVEGRCEPKPLQHWPHHRVKQKVKRKRQQVVHSGPSFSRLPSDLEDISPSLSDTSLSPDHQPRRKRHVHHHRKRRRIHSFKESEDSGSESDNSNFVLTSKELQKQIKAAISIDCIESHKNSLQNRLQAMKKDSDALDSANELNIDHVSVDDSLIQEVTNDTETKSSEGHNISGDENDLDSELIELRLEALKTALKNKYKGKRHKQEAQTDTNLSDTTNETNKENTNIHVSDTDQVQNTAENDASMESGPPSPEEDEDVLRALLLASMSRKITKKAAEINQTIISTKKPIVNNKNTKLVHKTTTNKTNIASNVKVSNIIKPFTIKTLKNNSKSIFSLNQNNKKMDKRVQNLPKVKPFIISVSSDSDTDDDWCLSQNLDKCIAPKVNISPVTSNTKNTEKVTIEIAPKTNINDSCSKLINLDSVEATKNDQKKTDNDLVESNPLTDEDSTKNVKVIPDLESSTKIPDTSAINNMVPTKIIPSIIESSVEKFLKEQRAKVDAENEAQISSTLIITRDVNNDDLIVGNKPPVMNVPNTQGPTTTPKKLSNIVITRNLKSGDKSVDLTPIKAPNQLPNSAVKLLPKNKQIEYQNLLLRLKNAEKNVGIRKPRIRKLSRRISISQTNNNISNQAVTPIPISPKATKPQPIENTSSETTNTSGESNNVLEERKSDALLLHSTLKEMQQKVDGRLQIQKKYNSLKPLMKKINEVSKQQKHWNQQVKKLLDELAEAKRIQENVHHEMTESVKLLVERKAQIDRQSATLTTAVKTNNTCLLPNSLAYQKSQVTSENITSRITRNINDPIITEKIINKSVITKTSNSLNTIATKQNVIMSPVKQTETSSAKGSSTTSDSDLNIGDPNDIDMIISKEHKKKVIRRPLVFNNTKPNTYRKALLQSKSSRFPNRTLINEPKQPIKRTQRVMKMCKTISYLGKEQVKDNPLIMENASKKDGNSAEDPKNCVEKTDLAQVSSDDSRQTLKLVNNPEQKALLLEKNTKSDEAQKADTIKQKLPENNAEATKKPTSRAGINQENRTGFQSCSALAKFKYVSPLDYAQRIPLIDPFSIMCPFEVDGTCKDPECSYRHFLPK